MTQLQLHPSLSFCDPGDRPVFLDLPGDRYFCLAGDLEEAWRAALLGAADRGQVDRLLARGLVVETDGQALAACPGHIPQRSALDAVSNGRSWRRAIGLRLAIARMRRKVKREPLISLIRAFVQAKANRQPVRASRTALADIAADLSRLDMLSTTLDQCLPRSLAVATHLAARGYRPELVLAVRLGPFGAHCWVECDGLLVNDRFERVRDFTPIRRL